MEASRKIEVIGEILDFCNQKHCYSYWSLIGYAKTEKFEWFPVIIENQEFFSSLFQNLRLDSIIEKLQNIDISLEQIGGGPIL